MEIFRIASFADGQQGGNPAGVVIDYEHPPEATMQSMAADIGYSETAFLAPVRSQDNLSDHWRVRYFSPESEVPFCGHATIALGAALTHKYGAGIFNLALNQATITVEGIKTDDALVAALQSPPTHSRKADTALVNGALALFGYQPADLDQRLPPAFIHGGANHLVFLLKSRELLSAMQYELAVGRQFMKTEDLVTVMFGYAETPTLFHTRNPFASGGVYEDPATGAASAAFAGYLNDVQWPHEGRITLIQGEDMGSRSLIQADINLTSGSSVRVSGAVRFLDAQTRPL